jgi:hypothetical protein
MASSETEIANMALSHLGIGKEIQNIETESSQEAKACRRFFDTARDAVLRDFPWPFATKLVDLGLVEEDPNDEWGFSYRYPSDAIALRRILSGIRNDTLASRVPYKVGQDSQGLLIFTDAEDAQMEYTVREEAVERFSPDFILALSMRLAVYVAPRLTGGDPFKIGQRAMSLYMAEIGLAQASATGEEQPEQQPDSEFITGRE